MVWVVVVVLGRVVLGRRTTFCCGAGYRHFDLTDSQISIDALHDLQLVNEAPTDIMKQLTLLTDS